MRGGGWAPRVLREVSVSVSGKNIHPPLVEFAPVGFKKGIGGFHENFVL